MERVKPGRFIVILMYSYMLISGKILKKFWHKKVFTYF